MAEITYTSKEYFRANTLLHGALLVGPMLFAFVATYLVANGGFGEGDSSLAEVFKYLVPVYGLITIWVSDFLFRMRIKSIQKLSRLNDKLVSYRQAIIVRYALLESGCLLSIIALMLTNNFTFLIATGLLLFFLFLGRPTKDKCLQHISFTDDELKRLLDDNQVVMTSSTS